MIYDRKYRAQFERHHNGQFAAIDINNELAYLAELPEQASSKARAASADGIFYLVRVGSPGAFKTSRFNAADPRSF
jgi:hypothetical protein